MTMAGIFFGMCYTDHMTSSSTTTITYETLHLSTDHKAFFTTLEEARAYIAQFLVYGAEDFTISRVETTVSSCVCTPFETGRYVTGLTGRVYWVDETGKAWLDEDDGWRGCECEIDWKCGLHVDRAVLY